MKLSRVGIPALTLALLALATAGGCAAPVARETDDPIADAAREGIASGKATFDHARWEDLLRRHVDERGFVDYAGFRKHRASLDAYLSAVGQADVASLSGPEIQALLINAYNACTVRLILDGASDGRFPASIRDLPDPWGRKLCTVGGRKLSLDAIEHGLLRPIFKDSRVHAAVNCASRSCPILVPWAYRGDRIDEQLRERMEAMVNSESYLQVRDGRLRVSSIFKWYGDDFVGGSSRNGAATLKDYLLRYARPDVGRRLEALGPDPRVEFLDYDWSLNGR